MTPVKKKRSTKLDSRSGDQVTYREGTSREVALLYAWNSVSTNELGIWEHMGQRSNKPWAKQMI